MNSRRIAWCILLILFSQQSLATMCSILMITKSGLNTGMTMHVIDCQNHSAYHASHAQHLTSQAEQHCQGSSASSLSVFDHSNYQNHCELCISGCHSLLYSYLEPQVVDPIDSVNLVHYDSFIPTAPVSHLFRPPILV